MKYGVGLERDLERLGIERAHAELVHALERALVERLGVLDRVQQRGVLGRLRRIEDPPQGEHEVVGGHRRAVRPGVVAQREGVDGAVVADLPALGGARNHAAVGRLGGQAQEHVADDPVLPDALDVVRVEGVRLARVRDAQLARGERAAAGRERRSAPRLASDLTRACSTPLTLPGFCCRPSVMPGRRPLLRSLPCGSPTPPARLPFGLLAGGSRGCSSPLRWCGARCGPACSRPPPACARPAPRCPLRGRRGAPCRLGGPLPSSPAGVRDWMNSRWAPWPCRWAMRQRAPDTPTTAPSQSPSRRDRSATAKPMTSRQKTTARSMSATVKLV